MFDENTASKRTICFPITDDEILLGMKIKGFGAGKYNGFGGKFDSSKGDKTIEDTAVRELREESKLEADVRDLEYVALIDFDFPAKPILNQRVRVYLLKIWKGAPGRTKEMDPKWFSRDNIPYRHPIYKMWDSDRLWLPSLLEGKKFYAKFLWKEDNESVAEYQIKFMDVLKY
jgi:ADP-ribose pyrophosphatase YjhB (NUDIX family)